jgi:hypothetical protein
MQTLYGLTENQMWEVYHECTLENWKQAIKVVYEDSTGFELTELASEEIAEIAINLWDDSGNVNSIENAILYEAIEKHLKQEE